jgi:hypothetical protein
MRGPDSSNITFRSSAVPTNPDFNGQLRAPGSSRRYGTIDTGSKPLEISSYTTFELFLFA